MEWLCACLLAAMFAAGLVTWMRVFRLWLLRPLESPSLTVELRLDNENECEYQLRAVLERLRWLQWPASLQLRCLNPTGSPGVEKIVERMAARYPCIVYGGKEPALCGCSSMPHTAVKIKK